MEYDYVIVGSGAGGGTVASRLATYGYRVLLVDAGGDESSSYEYQVPALHLFGTENKRTKWDFYVSHYRDLKEDAASSKMVWEKPDGQLGVGKKPTRRSKPLGIWYPRAGTLGGCTAHSSMVTILPNDNDWRHLADLTGDQTWNPLRMRRIFQRMEKNTYLRQCSLSRSCNQGHGFKGWLSTGITEESIAYTDVKAINLVFSMVRAKLRSNVHLVPSFLSTVLRVMFRDINSDVHTDQRRNGLFKITLGLKSGERSGVVDFIKETMQNEEYRLDVMLHTLVTKVIFTQEKVPRATGIEYLQGESLYKADPRYRRNAIPTSTGTIRAAKEIILSGGAFNTPQLLKLSGIGPKKELDKLGIPVLVNLPGVGSNLQDHLEISVVGNNSIPWKAFEKCSFLQGNPEEDVCLQKWKNKRRPVKSRGEYTTPGLSLAILKRSKYAENGIPDLFIAAFPGQYKGYYPGYALDSVSDKRQITWFISKGYTRNNAGTVTLKSKDPRDTPRVMFNFFDTASTGSIIDAHVMVEGLDFARKALAQRFQLGPKFWEIWPGEDVQSLEQKLMFVHHETWGHHATGTCAIGRHDNPMAVLDSKFRVRGVQNLRVVDASVFPKIPGYYVVLPTYMIGEKAADSIHFGT